MNKNQKILIIEDDPDLAELEQMELERVGYKVFSANDKSSARNMLENDVFDCILLDLTLGNDSGHDIIKFIRKPKSINLQTCILLVSGTLDIQIVKDSREDVQGVMVKPFNFEQLVSKVETVLEQRKLAPKKIAKELKKYGCALIVDDNPEFCDMVTSSFKEIGFQVVTAYNPNEAIRKLQLQRFDCILLDFDFGSSKNGAWIVEQIRRDKACPNNTTPIMIVSGSTTGNFTAISNYVQDFIEKPVNPAEVAEKAKSFIGKRVA